VGPEPEASSLPLPITTASFARAAGLSRCRPFHGSNTVVFVSGEFKSGVEAWIKSMS
jgi:hypothetical protein